MRNIYIQLERLQRHYQTSVRTYDTVSLLDLSHVLRIWADMKSSLPAQSPAFAKTIAFKSALPAKKVMRIARSYRHVFAYMPSGVVTYASNGELASGPDFEGPSGNLSCGTSFKINADGSMELKNFSYIATNLDQKAFKALSAVDISRGNYVQWMGSEVARLAYPIQDGSLVRASLSREQVIRRVANTLEGSHPSSEHLPGSPVNQFDIPVKELLQYKIGGLPLPYFILLKTAQDIIELAPRLLSNPHQQ